MLPGHCHALSQCHAEANARCHQHGCPRGYLGLVRNLPCPERSEINADTPNAFLIGGGVIPAAPWCLVPQKKYVASYEGGVCKAHAQFWDFSPVSDAPVFPDMPECF